MQKVLEQVKQEKRPSVLEFNMRKMPFVDVNTFVNKFSGRLLGWYNKCFGFFKNIKQININDLSVRAIPI